MRWSSSELSSDITDVANKQKLLIQSPNKIITDELKELIKNISIGISKVHGIWQQSVRVRNVKVSGGTASIGGPINSAVGIGSPQIFTENFTASDLTNAIDAAFPSKLYKVETNEVKALTKAIGVGFAKTWNQWISTTGISGVLVSGGSSSHTDKSPGSLQNAVGTLPTLQQGLTEQIDFGMFIDSTIAAMSGLLKQSPSKKITDELYAVVKSLSDGLKTMQTTWLQSTQLSQLQVNGGQTAIAVGSLISPANGVNGRLV